MTDLLRPKIREAFLAGDRQLNVFFYTSNTEKYLQARLVFERSGLLLRHFRTRQDPYEEDYSHGKERLLAKAIGQILTTVGRGSVFFVEDTSLRIEALSSPSSDFPGLSVKEWFSRTTFTELDDLLRSSGNDRRAEVASDIALHLPGLKRPILFRGLTRGMVAATPPEFEADPLHPWLTPATFNGWFIPQGGQKRLGEMTFEDSWGFDFRVKALANLLDRLEEYAAVLNMPFQAYTRKQHPGRQVQPSLFPPKTRHLVVVGRTCAGKTTFGETAAARYSMQFIDASSMLRGLENQYDRSERAQESAYEFAHRTLEEKGADIVARKIVHLYGDSDAPALVITGFRTIEELETAKSVFDNVEVIFVEASERTRFERQLNRARGNGPKSLQAFRELDKRQWSFGLLQVAEDFADVRIINEGTLDSYRAQIDAVIGNRQDVHGVSRVPLRPRHKPERNQLYRCLKILAEAGRPLTTEEIDEVTAAHARRIRHNNANKVLKRHPELAKRYEMEEERVRYQVTNAGWAYIRLFERHFRRSDDT